MARYEIVERNEIAGSGRFLWLCKAGNAGYVVEIISQNPADRDAKGFAFGSCSRRLDEKTARSCYAKCLEALASGKYDWAKERDIVQCLGGVRDEIANRRVFDTPQKRKIRDELLRLEAARRNIFSREGYNKACIALECAEFPYALVQLKRDDTTGEVFRNYKYAWKSTGKFGDDTCAIYIEETDAHKKPQGGIGKALDLIEDVLLPYC